MRKSNPLSESHNLRCKTVTLMAHSVYIRTPKCSMM